MKISPDRKVDSTWRTHDSVNVYKTHDSVNVYKNLLYKLNPLMGLQSWTWLSDWTTTAEPSLIISTDRGICLHSVTNHIHLAPQAWFGSQVKKGSFRPRRPGCESWHGHLQLHVWFGASNTPPCTAVSSSLRWGEWKCPF